MENLNRKILFRGKRLNGKEWLRGDLNHIDGKVFIFQRTPDTPLNSPDWFEVDPQTVGQYIGIETNGGDKIFEGSIISMPDISINGGEIIYHGNQNRVVVYYNDQFRVTFPRKNKVIQQVVYVTPQKMTHYEWLNCRVIGNLIDNPELLSPDKTEK